MSIAAQHMTIRRLDRTVLRDVSFTIRSGECVSIIGPNGAGKSTLLAGLAGLLPLASGEVRLDDRPIRSLPRRQIARYLAYVPQIHDGFMGFAVSDVIESARYAHRQRLEPLSQADRVAIREAILATHIEPLLDRTVDTLSGGERQKVWITAALSQQSPALLLDEPTSALDPAHQAELVHIMRGASAAGKTLVVISHDLNLPLALGGRVIALQDGAIAFDERVAALSDTQRLNRLFGTAFSLHHGPAGSVSIHLEIEGVNSMAGSPA